MQKVIICNRFAYPDNSATSQLLSDLAAHISTQEKPVTIITSRYYYAERRSALPTETNWKGVTIHRVWSSNFGRATLGGRVIDLLTFSCSLAIKLYIFTEKGDVLIAKTDPPVLSIICAAITRLKGSVAINWLQDLYPELAVALGLISGSNIATRILRRLRNWSLATATANVVICKSMSDHLSAQGHLKRIVEIPNWTHEGEIRPIPHNNNPLRKEWRLESFFVVGYSGNLGQAHESDTVFEAAKILRHNGRIRFLIIGGGGGHRKLHQRVVAEGLSEIFIFKPYQEECELSRSLSAADVHWVSLRPECEGLVYPSKIYGIAAVGRPIIVIAAQSSDLTKLIKQYACGFSILPLDANALSKLILSLERNRDLCVCTGRNAREMVENDYARTTSLQKWTKVIQASMIYQTPC